MGRSRTVLVHGILLASSLYCLRRCPSFFRYARAAVRMYAATGFCGILHYGFRMEVSNCLFQTLWIWSYCIGLPLIGSDLTVYNGLPLNTTPLHLFIPFCSLVQFHFTGERLDFTLLRASLSLSVLTLLLHGLITDHTPSCFIYSTYGLAIYSVDLVGIETVSRSEMWALLIAISNCFLPNALPFDLDWA